VTIGGPFPISMSVFKPHSFHPEDGSSLFLRNLVSYHITSLRHNPEHGLSTCYGMVIDSNLGHSYL